MALFSLFTVPFPSRSFAQAAEDSISAAPKPTPTEVREQSTARDANTRVWENVYRTPILDPRSGQPTGQTTETLERYFEKGTNICYDSRENPADPASPAPQWQPTEINIETCGTGAPAGESDPLASGFAYQVVRGPVKAYFKASPLAADANVRLTPRGEAPIDAQILGLVYYDPATGSTRAVDAIRPIAPHVEGNRLIYPGAFACGSLEYIYTNLGVEQDVVIEHPEALPNPASVGFDPDTAQLLVISNIKPANPAIQVKILGPQPDATDGATTAVLSADLRTTDLSDLSKSRIKGKNLSLQLQKSGSGDSPVQIGEFALGSAWDAASSPAKTDLYKVIERADASGSISLKEGIALSYLRAPGRQFPVRIDWAYISKSGTMVPKGETWVKGMTYLVSSVYTIPSGSTLVIEPGVIVKARDNLNPAIYVSTGASLSCKGTTYDPIYFVPAQRNGIGLDISPVIYMDPVTYIESLASSSYIDNVKFFGAGTAIKYSFPPVYNLVTNCVFQNQTSHAIYCANVPSSWGLTVFNCLFNTTGAGAAIETGDIWPGSHLVEVVNCTFSGTYTSGGVIKLVYNTMITTNPTLNIRNNIFNVTATNCILQVNSANGSETGYVTDNRYNTGRILCNEMPIGGTTMDDNSGLNISFAQIEDQFSGNPTGNGDFYPQAFAYANGDWCLGSTFKDQGVNAVFVGSNLTSDIMGSLKKRTIVRPIRIGDTTTGSPYYDINGTLNANNESPIFASASPSTYLDQMADQADGVNTFYDIGYHYPLVHGVMESSSITCQKDISLPLGTVIASLGPNSVFAFSGPNRTFRAIGTPSNYIRFIDYAQAGDAALAGSLFISNSGSCANRYFNIDVTQMKPQGVQFQYCIMERANTAICVYGPYNADYPTGKYMRPVIADSIFRYNGNWTQRYSDPYLPRLEGGVGIGFCDADVMNCLFENNRMGVYINNFGDFAVKTQFQPSIIGCTFSGGAYGTFIAPGYANYSSTEVKNDHTYALIEDNIFTNVAEDDVCGDINLTTSHIDNYQIGGVTRTNLPNVDTDPADPPLFCNYSMISALGTSVGDWRADDDNSAKFYLAQEPDTGGMRNNDASREPLVTGAIDSVAVTNQPGTTMKVSIYGSNTSFVGGSYYGIPSPDVFALANNLKRDSTNNTGHSAVSNTLAIVQCLSGTNLYGGSFTITFRSKNSASGLTSKVTCRLPNVSLPVNNLMEFWVAQDGSLYWATATQVQTSAITPEYNAPYAMHSITTGLASAYFDRTASAHSPAIDKGSNEYISGGFTSTQSIFDHTLPKDYRTGYIRGDDSDQATELAKQLDLGFHYGGTAQDYAPKANPPASGSWQGNTTLAPAIRLMPVVPPILRMAVNAYFSEDYPSAMPTPKCATSWPDYSVASYQNGATGKTTIFSTYTTGGEIHDDYTGVPAAPSYVFPDSTGNTWPMPPISALFCREADASGNSWNGSLTRELISPDALIWRDPSKGGGYWLGGSTWFDAPLYSRVPYRPGHISSIDSVAIPSNITIAGGNPLQNGDKFVAAYVSYFTKQGTPNYENPEPTPLATATPANYSPEQTYLWKHDYQKDTSKISIYLAKHTDGVGSYIEKIQNGHFSANPSSSYWSASPAAAWTFSNHVDAVLTPQTPGPATLTQNCPVLANRKYYFSCSTPVMEGSGWVTVKVGNCDPQPLISGSNGFVLTAAQTMTTDSFVITITKNSDTFKVDINSVSLTLMDFATVEYSTDSLPMSSGVMDGSVAATYYYDDVLDKATVHLFWTISMTQTNDGIGMSYPDGIIHGTYDPVNQTIIASTEPAKGVQGVSQPADVYSSTDSNTWDDPSEPRHVISAAFDKSVGRIRVVWPKGYTNLLRTGRYNPDQNTFSDGNPTELNPNYGDINNRAVNSIAYANYNTTSVPAWLKSSSLKMENFIASDKSTWRCTTSGTNNESDDWGSKQDQPELSVTTGYSRTTVAARGSRIPRYAGRGDGIQDSSGYISGSVYADGIIALGRGRQPMIRSNANNFIDQYIVSQSARMDTNDGSITRNAPLAVVPMRP